MEQDKKRQAEEKYRAAEEAKRAAEEARRKEEHILAEAKRTTARLEAEWKKMEEEEREKKEETERGRERLRREAEQRRAEEERKEEEKERGLIAMVRNAEKATVEVLRACFLRRTEEVKQLEASCKQRKELLELEADVGRRRAMLEMQLKELAEQRAAAEQRTAKLLSEERAREQAVQLDAKWAATERSRMQEAASLAEELREAAAAGAAACGSRLRGCKEADNDGSDVFYSDESEASYETCDDLPLRAAPQEKPLSREEAAGGSQPHIELQCVKRDLEMWLDELQHGASTGEPFTTSPGWPTTYIKRDLEAWLDDLHVAPPPRAFHHGDLYRTLSIASEGPPPERWGEEAALPHLPVDDEDFLYTDVP